MSSTRASQRLQLASRGGGHATAGGDSSFSLSEGGRISAEGEESTMNQQQSSSYDQPRRLRSSDRITRGVRTSSSSSSAATSSLLSGASPRNSRLVLLQESSSSSSEINAACKSATAGLSSPTSPKKIFSQSKNSRGASSSMKGEQQQVSSSYLSSATRHEDEEGKITSSVRASSPSSRSTLLSSPSHHHHPVHAPSFLSPASPHHLHSPRMRTRSSTSNSGGGGCMRRDLSQANVHLSSSKMTNNNHTMGSPRIGGGLLDKVERRPRQSADQTAPPLVSGNDERKTKRSAISRHP